MLDLLDAIPDWNLQGVTSNVGVSSSDHQIMSSDMIVVKSRLLSRMEDALEQFNRQMVMLKDQTAQKLQDWYILAADLDRLHRENLERIAVL